jgi:protein O-GlcNAc transferase
MKKSEVRLLETAFANQRAGRFADAINICRRLLAKTSNNFDCIYLLAQLYLQTNNMGPALAMLRRAADLKPAAPDVLYNLAVALSMTGEYAEAASRYGEILKRDPGHLGARSNYAASLLAQDKFSEALSQYNELIAANPALPEAYVNRGIALQKLGRAEEALGDFEKAVALRPEYPEALLNWANSLTSLDRGGEAFSLYNRAIELKPDFAPAYNARLHLCDWSNLATQRDELIALAKRGTPEYPWGLVALIPDPKEQLECARTFARSQFPPSPQPLWQGEIYRHDKIRIAYVSSDLRDHPMAYLAVGMFECHDRSRFEVTAISLGPDAESEFSQRIRRSFDVFINGRVLGDDEIAAQVKKAKIDILVDLNGFTVGGRTGIFARRPAPVQLNFPGFAGTMGADYYDYIVADETVVPSSDQAFYSEKIMALPDTYLPNDRQRPISDRVFARAEVGLPDTGFVFCCFNNNYKILPDVFDSWMRILGQVEHSVLWLFEDNPAAATNLRKEAVARGIAAERLVFARRMPVSEHLARSRLADLFLDTLPYNAHTTASDALWVGVPLLTRIGGTFAGRVAASLLKAVGLPELITSEREQYERVAVDLATDPDKLQAIKAKLAHNRLTTALFDTKLYTRNVERAYQVINQRQREGLPPEHIVISSVMP